MGKQSRTSQLSTWFLRENPGNGSV